MPRPVVQFYTVVARGLPRYTCVVCKASALGSTVRVDVPNLNGTNGEIVGKVLSQHPVSNNYMPVGWSGSGMDSHRCLECREK